MFLETKGIRTYYEKGGNGTAIFLLHGWEGRANSLRPIFNLLKNNFCVYSLDLPGFGMTDFPKIPWGTEDYAFFVREFLDKLGISRCDIIGHSFGGRIGIWLSSNYPEIVNRLILIAPSGIKPRRKPMYFLKVLIAKLAKNLPYRLKEAIYNRIGSKDYRLSSKEMRQTLVKIVNEDMRPLLSKITLPTLIIWGENDGQTPLYQGKIMEEEIKNSKLVVIKNAGHFPYLDNFFDFSHTLLDFLGCS